MYKALLKIHSFIQNVEFEDADETLKNVWLTDIMKNELDNHSLEEGKTFIMPLGPSESKETGKVFWVFVDVDRVRMLMSTTKT